MLVLRANGPYETASQRKTEELSPVVENGGKAAECGPRRRLGGQTTLILLTVESGSLHGSTTTKTGSDQALQLQELVALLVAQRCWRSTVDGLDDVVRCFGLVSCVSADQT